MVDSSFYGDTPNYATDYPTQNDSNTNPVAGNSAAPSSFYPNGGIYEELVNSDTLIADVEALEAQAAAAASAAASSASSSAASAAAAAASASTASTTFLQKANNLSDLTSVATAKANLALVKGDVGLGNVDNTSDVNKPVSTAQATADALVASNAAAATALKANIASPALTGTPSAPTAAALNNSTQIATTAYADAAVSTLSGTVNTALALKAPLASPALTGTPTAPTATAGTNTTQLATTAFVLANGGALPATATPLVNSGAGAVGTATKYAREDHVHPLDTSRAPFEAMAQNGMQINGAFEVDQTVSGNTALVSGTEIYVQDGAKAKFVGSTVISAAPSGGAIIGFPAGFQSNVALFQTSGSTITLAAGDYHILKFPIEGYRFAKCQFGTASAQSVTVTAMLYSDVAGIVTIALQNSAGNRTRPQQVTLAGTGWQYVTTTFPGDTTGTWLTTNGVGCWVIICAGSGSTNQGTVNSWNANALFAASGQTTFLAANSSHFGVTGLVVLPGTEAPSSARLPLVMRPYDQELQLCYRQLYVWKAATAAQRLAYAAADTTTTAQTVMYLPCALRTSPTITVAAVTLNGQLPTAAPYGTYTSSAQGLLGVGWTIASGLVASTTYPILASSASGTLTIDARL